MTNIQVQCISCRLKMCLDVEKYEVKVLISGFSSFLIFHTFLVTLYSVLIKHGCIKDALNVLPLILSLKMMLCMSESCQWTSYTERLRPVNNHFHF